MKVRFSTEARRDRREAEAYYAGISPGARWGFQRDLQAAVQYVITYPLGAPVRSHEVRAKRLIHFPYTLLYRVHGRAIFILAIAHHAREPEYYASRFE